MTTTTATAIAPITPPLPTENTMPDIQVDEDKLVHHLCIVSVTKRAPTYKFNIEKCEVMSISDDGEAVTVQKKDRTASGWKWGEGVNIFKELQANEAQINRVLNIYALPDMKRGDKLVPLYKCGELLQRLNALRNERISLVNQFIEHGDEILAMLKTKFHAHWSQFEKKIFPFDQSLHARYEVFWDVRPMVGIDPSKELDLSKLSNEEAEEVCAAYKEQKDDAFAKRAEIVADVLFGEIIKTCEDALLGELDEKTGKRKKGSLEGGHRNTGTINQIMDVLDRMINFKEFTTEHMIEQVTKIKKMLTHATPKDINFSQGNNVMVQAVKANMAPLVKSAKAQLAELKSGRAKRAVSI